MPFTAIDIGATYAISGGNLAIPQREYTEADGTTWVEAEVSRGEDDVIERYPKTKFLDMILQKMTVETYRDHASQDCPT
jgi:hypothetical protein